MIKKNAKLSELLNERRVKRSLRIGWKVMKSEKVLIVTALIIMFIFISCENSHRDLVQSYNVETEMIAEFKPADFHTLEEWFNEFDPEHIYNFHYADVTNYSSRVPGPTDDRIEGFFNISEEKWDFYVENYEWRNISGFEFPAIDHIPDASAQDDLNWLNNSSWIAKHRGERVGGLLYICKENRLVWFSLWR